MVVVINTKTEISFHRDALQPITEMTGFPLSLLVKAIQARSHLFDERHESAFRLFNGFYEGNLDLAKRMLSVGGEELSTLMER